MRKAIRKIHLWLGLLSGAVVFVVCITGGLYVFKDEIETIAQPWRKVQAAGHGQVTLPPSALIAIADNVTGQQASAVTTGGPTDAVWADYYSEDGMTTVFLNPYSGRVLHVDYKGNDSFDFFKFILRGHRTLWLPREIGQPIVSYGTLLFLIELLTGLVIWLPKKKNRKSLSRMLRFSRPFRWRNFIFDLHAVAGMYLLIPLIVLCLTGMIFGIGWFSQGVYSLVSGGRSMEAYALPASDTTLTTTAGIDLLASKIRKEEPQAVQLYYALPRMKADVYRVSVVHEQGSYYKQDNRYFDQYTLRELKGKGPWAGRYAEATSADRIMRMNLDIHSGRIFGLTGKIIMFLASLVGASLPVTGVVLWWPKRKEKRKKKEEERIIEKKYK